MKCEVGGCQYVASMGSKRCWRHNGANGDPPKPSSKSEVPASSAASDDLDLRVARGALVLLFGALGFAFDLGREVERALPPSSRRRTPIARRRPRKRTTRKKKVRRP